MLMHGDARIKDLNFAMQNKLMFAEKQGKYTRFDRKFYCSRENI